MLDRLFSFVSLATDCHETANERHDLQWYKSTLRCGGRGMTYETRANIDNILGHQEDQSVHLTCNRNGEFCLMNEASAKQSHNKVVSTYHSGDDPRKDPSH